MTPSPLDCLTLFTLPNYRLITFTGAGGKTSLCQWFGRSATADGRKVIITTTTKIFPPRGELTILENDGPHFLQRVQNALAINARVVVAKRYDTNTGKLIGLHPRTVSKLHASGVADTMLVEADGAARKPLKAPKDNEPVIPIETDLCVAVMGLDGLGKPLRESIVHRHEIFSQVTGLTPGKLIQLNHLIRVATDPCGLFKGCPSTSDQLVFLNKSDLTDGLNGIDITTSLATELLCTPTQRIARWFVGSAQQKKATEVIPTPFAMANNSSTRLDFSPEF